MVFARPTPKRTDVIKRNVAGWRRHQFTEGPRRGAWSYPPAARTATTPTPSSPCWPCTRPSSAGGRRTRAIQSTTAPGGWPRPIGKTARTPTARGATTRARQHRQHDLRGHRLDGHRRATASIRPTPWSPATRSSAAARRRGKLPHRTGLSGWATTSRVDQIPAPRATVAALLPLRRGTRRTHDRPPLHRRARLVSRRRRLPAPAAGAFTAFGPVTATPKTMQVSAPAWRCCFFPRGAGPCCWPSSSTAPATTGTSTAATWATSPVYVESRWKLDLTWQVIDLQGPRSTTCCSRRCSISAAAGAPCQPTPSSSMHWPLKLRDYLDRGGFLFAEAYCGGEGFDRGFRELMTLVFPRARVSPATAGPPASDLVCRGEGRPGPLRPLEGIDFGCRTSVVYAPPDPPQGAAALALLPVGAVAGRPQQKFTPAVQDRSTPRCSSASMCWPMPPIAK